LSVRKRSAFPITLTDDRDIGRARDHWAEQDAEERIEQPGRDRNANRIVDEGECRPVDVSAIRNKCTWYARSGVLGAEK